MKTLAITVCSASLLFLVGCKRPAPQEHAHEDAHGEQATAGKDGSLPLTGLRGIASMTAPEPRAEGAWFPAEAIGDVETHRELTAPVGGIVTAIRVGTGRHVGRGTALLTLQSPELARLKADWLGARARLDKAEAELAREERLFAAGAGSQRDVEVARAEARTVRAEQEASRLALEARGVRPESAGAVYTMSAPADGSVVGWKVHVGEGLSAGQAVGVFQTGAAALARVELAPPAPSWKSGDVTEARSTDGREWRAVVEGLPTALGESRRLTYSLRLSGAAPPMPGLPLEVRVPLATGVILPQNAVQQLEGVWGVFLREGEQARFVPVRRGAELGGDVLILEGVRPGDSVVTEGAYLLKSLRLRRSGAEEEHEH